MYRNLLCLLAVAGLPLLSAAKDNVHLHGKITNPISDSISVEFNSSRIAYHKQAYAVALGKDGKFEMALELPEGYTRATLSHGNQSTDLILKPDYDLTLSLNAQNFDSTLHYEGNGSKEENFVARHVLEHNMMINGAIAIQPYYGKKPEVFEHYLDSVQQQEMSFINANKQGVPASFINFWKNHYNYDYYYSLQNYPIYSEITREKSYSIKMDSIPAAAYAVALKVPVVYDDEMLNDDSYHAYLESVNTLPLNAAHAGQVRIHLAEDSVLRNAFKIMPPKTAEYYVAEHIYRGIKYIDEDQTDANMAMFKEHFPKSAYLATLNEAVDHKKKFGVGKVAPNFKGKTADGKEVSLADLKGKVVYLDFWASWCGPCAAEMPAAQKIEANYKDKNIVFLYVSIDQDAVAWKKAIDLHHIEGVNLIDDGAGWAGKIAKQYSVEGVPSYFLIDKNGNFAAQNVPRPSDGPMLSAALDKVLMQ